MIYIGDRRRIPADHPKDSASNRPYNCEVCGSGTAYANVALTWVCRQCIRPFLSGYIIGEAVGAHKAVLETVGRRT